MARRLRIDRTRFSQLASRPGIDPRVWLAIATVKEVGFDPVEGTFVDLQMLPGGETETAYLGSPYAGNQFGDHCPVSKGDSVLIGIPNGDPAAGPIIICRWNDAADVPHADFDSQDRVIRVEPGKNLRLVVSEGATLKILVEKGATVQIGDELQVPGLNGVLNGEAIDPFTGLTHFLLGNSSLTVAAKKGPPG